jgi:hypothetical protein
MPAAGGRPLPEPDARYDDQDHLSAGLVVCGSSTAQSVLVTSGDEASDQMSLIS